MCECFISHLQHLGIHLAQQPWRDVAQWCAVSIRMTIRRLHLYFLRGSLLKMEGEAFKITQPTAFLIKFRLSKILQSHQRSGHLLLVMHIASTAQQSSVQAVLQLPRSLIINRLISSMKGTLICKRKFKDYTVYPYKLSDLEPSSPPPSVSFRFKPESPRTTGNPSPTHVSDVSVAPGRLAVRRCCSCCWISRQSEHIIGGLASLPSAFLSGGIEVEPSMREFSGLPTSDPELLPDFPTNLSWNTAKIS